MKRNDPYHWAITLRGKTRTDFFFFVGRIDEALDAADERESTLAFTVLEYHILRGMRAKSNTKLGDAQRSP